MVLTIFQIMVGKSLYGYGSGYVTLDYNLDLNPDLSFNSNLDLNLNPDQSRAPIINGF